ncbi:hypothetical protein ACFXKX_35600 [Streptomyces scopuliridis]|uniref:hypothetical protein n=1 Tax=Streptomyces scopuliridis TaxID=452529 RepID=UPI0036C28791
MNRHALTTAAGLTLLAAIQAPAAHADYARDSSSCTRNDRDHWRSSHNDHRTRVRTGPGSEYSVKDQMGPLALLRVHCSAVSRGGQRWYYGRASLDSNGARQTMGWVWSGQLT